MEFKASVVKIIDGYVVLDKTAFYPTSGGQMHDTGMLNGGRVVDVIKQDNVVLHKVIGDLRVGQEVKGLVDFERRKQLSQHHTATHVINAAARRILGGHVNQAGAKKTLEKAHLDISHYQAVTEKEVEKIEKEANLIVKQAIPVNKMFLERDEAERRFGMGIYQGGAVPGAVLRIVEIPGVDVEACAGTHLDNTSEIEKIKIVKTTKISDNVVRIEFKAGSAAVAEEDAEHGMLVKLADELGCEINQIPGRAKELFEWWKQVVKKKRKLEKIGLVSVGVYEGDVLAKTAEILKTQPTHVLNTIRRFKKELKEKKAF